MSVVSTSTPLSRLTSPRLWLTPAIVVTVLMAALAAMYLSGTVNSTDNIADFPVAIVNADTGADSPAGGRVAIGEQIVGGLRQQVDSDEFDLRVLTLAEAKDEMSRGEPY